MEGTNKMLRPKKLYRRFRSAKHENGLVGKSCGYLAIKMMTRSPYARRRTNGCKLIARSFESVAVVMWTKWRRFFLVNLRWSATNFS